jgi:hypothetical protein
MTKLIVSASASPAFTSHVRNSRTAKRGFDKSGTEVLPVCCCIPVSLKIGHDMKDPARIWALTPSVTRPIFVGRNVAGKSKYTLVTLIYTNKCAIIVHIYYFSIIFLFLRYVLTLFLVISRE